MTRARLLLALFVAALALPGVALAQPTVPVVHPVPATVTVWPGIPFTVVWDASAASATHYAACCTYALPLLPGHRYVVSVRAGEQHCTWDVCHASWSAWRSVQFETLALPAVDITP